MIVQWCSKGVAKLDEATAVDILGGGAGIRCRGWLELGPAASLPLDRILGRLNEPNLDLHVNDYSRVDPRTGKHFFEITPFISLAAGVVDRDVTKQTNVTHGAFRTALEFACTDYTDPRRPPCPGWIFVCYVLVGVRPAPTIPGVAEEVRELKHLRPYSPWYLQGEVTAKVNVPSRQILYATRWAPDSSGALVETDVLWNRAFTHPVALLDIREML